jgi:hypothetical protein
MQNKQIFKWNAPVGEHKAVLIGYRYDWYGKFKKLIFTFRIVDNFNNPTDYTVGIPTNAPLDKNKELDTDRIGNNSKSTPHWILKAITKKDEWDAFEQKLKHIDELVYSSDKPLRIVEIKSIIKNNCSLLAEIYSDIEDAWIDVQRKADNHVGEKKIDSPRIVKEKEPPWTFMWKINNTTPTLDDLKYSLKYNYINELEYKKYKESAGL